MPIFKLTLPGVRNHWRNIFKVVVPTVFVIIIAANGFAFSPEQKTDTIALKVDETEISEAFLNRRVFLQKEFYRQAGDNTKTVEQITQEEIEAVIESILGEKELNKLGKEVTQEDVLAEQKDRISSFEAKNPNESYEESLLKKYSQSLEDERYLIQRQFTRQKINELALKKEISGIWLNRPTGKLEDEQVQQQAKDILNQVKAGNDFSDLARKYSEDTASRANGGKLGIYPFEPENQAAFPALCLTTAYRELSADEAELYVYPTGVGIMKVTKVIGSWQYVDYFDFVTKAKQKAEIKIFTN